MHQRFEQLDSLRGLAASCVLIGHVSLVFPAVPLLVTQLLTWSPLRILVNGGGAVMFFFVLSGFVLALPFLSQTKVEYFPYLIKRIFRIYIPFVIALGFSVMLSYFISGDVDKASAFVNIPWSAHPFNKYLLESLTLVGNIHSDAYDPVIWSLAHEMRLSIIFPLIVLCVNKFNLKSTLFICFILAIIGGLNNKFTFELSNGYATTYFDTLRFIPMFIMGVLIAKYRIHIIDGVNRLSMKMKLSLLLISLIVYNFSESIFPYIIEHVLESNHLMSVVGNGLVDLGINQYGEMLGAIGIIVIVLSSVKVEKWLLKKPFLFLGRISYSLYLYHLPVMLFIVHLLYRHLPIVPILLLSIVVSFMVATIARRYIEIPCISCGRLLSKKVTKVIHKRRLPKSA
ncbi:peptidoglycan/LPS O-acetylase OafA/YrhL [Pullulanibacillus pueri]|uniref:Acyltransferase n=1 Tax=Pullulanibacillus pueri TaxID=1437324 RepID=A0A8J2ZVZ0_9BACL|nr:acyltransferase [Pullulanibacillus pueri]MBM7682442.1 peptidoglycan/LPS O-acetylase OafA/YrhL [Pullulanibacillus pueri]GGH81623.1 acyltransferase [Pullulanibacillus pueri]